MTTDDRLAAYMQCEVERDALRQDILDRGRAVRDRFVAGRITSLARVDALAALFDEWAVEDEELTAKYSKIMRDASAAGSSEGADNGGA